VVLGSQFTNRAGGSPFARTTGNSIARFGIALAIGGSSEPLGAMSAKDELFPVTHRHSGPPQSPPSYYHHHYHHYQLPSIAYLGEHGRS
jgi:hypothetical protein